MIVALTGNKGSGKDTVANILVEAARFKKIAFMDPLKEQIQQMFGLETESEYDLFKRASIEYTLSDSVKKVADGRNIVREIGMLMRNIDSDQFTRRVWDEINLDMGADWVVTDLRFDNELEFMREMGALVVKIKSPETSHDDHITERGFEDSECDIIIDNNGSLDDLTVKVISLILEDYNS